MCYHIEGDTKETGEVLERDIAHLTNNFCRGHKGHIRLFS